MKERLSVLTLADIVKASGDGILQGDKTLPVTGVATLEQAGPQEISFFTHSRYRKQLEKTQAAAVILTSENKTLSPVATLVSKNPQLAYAKIAALFSPKLEQQQRGIHPAAWVSERAQVAADAWIGPHSTVEAEAIVGSRSFLGPNCVIGQGVKIGADCQLIANVSICHHSTLGERVIVHPGAVIGGDGFGLANNQGRWVKIPQLGSVIIGDDVEIGCNTTIDRGALDNTIIEQGVKLDNQIQIAHNVRIGAHTAIAGCVGIAGSAHIGRYCSIGGGVGIAGHLEIVDHVVVTGMSLVAKSITKPGVYSSGLTVEPNRVWNKINVRLRRLEAITRRLWVLEKKLSQQG